MSKIEEEELNKIMSASVTTAADMLKACDTMAAFINGVIELPPRTIRKKDKRTMESKIKEEKYILMYEMNGDIFTDYFTEAEKAIEAGEDKLYRMTKYEKARCSGLYVLETVNTDKEAEDHFDGDIVKRWI